MALWGVGASFFLVAAAVQLLLGLFIFMRRPRMEPAAILGALFALNGALSLNAFLVHIGLYDGSSIYEPVPGPGGRIHAVFDRTTTLLVGYLALAYPRRPRWAAGRPWLLPTLFFVALASMLLPAYLGVPDIWPLDSDPPRPGCGTPCFEPRDLSYWSTTVLTIGFPLLLVRWAWLLPSTRSPLELRQFGLLFAAFAVRAVHVELLFGVYAVRPVLVDTLDAFFSPWGPVKSLRAVFSLVAIAASAVLLVRRRGAPKSDLRRMADLVLAFMLAGALEFLLNQTLDLFDGGLSPYIYSPFLQMDLLVLRPILVFYAMMRYDLFGPLRHARLAGGIVLAALAFLTFMNGLAFTFRRSAAPLVFAAAGAAVLTVATMAFLRPYLDPRRTGPDGSTAPPIQAYVEALEDAHRNGAPSPAQREALAERRSQLGVSREQADALEAAVRSRWSGTVGPAAWAPGETLAGRYRVESFLGEGAAGEVYQATDLLASQRVVLKRTRRLDEAARRALLREATHLARLDHPRVVRLLRTEALGAEPILVLEHLAGGSLAKRLARGPLSAAQATRLAGDVLEGLQAAHAAGIVHRDIKPSNILFDADGNAKLADFGVARSTAAGPALVAMTATEAGPPGSLRYMSPEQVKGLPTDARADIYSLGIVLAEAVGGVPHPTHPATDYDVRRAIVEGPGPRLPPRLPARLAAAIRGATRKDPATRTESAAGMALALRGSAV